MYLFIKQFQFVRVTDIERTEFFFYRPTRKHKNILLCQDSSVAIVDISCVEVGGYFHVCIFVYRLLVLPYNYKPSAED